jgi:hypothetical protein
MGEKDDSHFSVISFGGGVNSTAMLIEMVNRDERPNAILFADTGGEKPLTYDHIERMQSWLESKKFPPITLVKGKSTLEADCLDRETLPGKAFGFGSCSEHFKVRPQKRWLRDNVITNAMWLVGIHIGERHRAERTLNQRADVRFPLIEWGWGQEECVESIVRAGLPVPIKSACFYCPSMRKQEVLELAKSDPELFKRAVEMERTAKEAGTLKTIRGLGRRWSWESLLKADESQLRLPMFDDLQAPICDTCVDW